MTLVKAFVFGGEVIDFGGLFADEFCEAFELGPHVIAYQIVFVFASDAALVFGENPGGGLLAELRAAVTPGADEIMGSFAMPGHLAAGLVF